MAAFFPVIAYEKSFGGTLSVTVGSTTETVTVASGSYYGWGASTEAQAQAAGTIWRAVADAIATHSLVSACTTQSRMSTSTIASPQVQLRVSAGDSVVLASGTLSLVSLGLEAGPITLTADGGGVYTVNTSRPWRGFWCPMDPGAQVIAQTSQRVGVATPLMDPGGQTAIRYGEVTSVVVSADYVRPADIWEQDAAEPGYASAAGRTGFGFQVNVLSVVMEDLLAGTGAATVGIRIFRGGTQAQVYQVRVLDAEQWEIGRFSETVEGRQYYSVSLAFVEEA